jgi:5-methylcytosine-specific restriction enzyme subunit McrC
MVERLELVEYVPRRLPAGAISEALGRRLWATYGEVVDVAFPSPKTADSWQLTAQGYAGYIPLDAALHLLLTPKVRLDNLLYLLAYVYDLDQWRLRDGLQPAASLTGFYEQLADLLARRVLRRVRQGLHRAYVVVERPLPYVRGQLLPQQDRPASLSVAIPCRYEEQTALIAPQPDHWPTRWAGWRGATCSARPCSSEWCEPTVCCAIWSVMGNGRLPRPTAGS